MDGWLRRNLLASFCLSVFYCKEAKMACCGDAAALP